MSDLFSRTLPSSGTALSALLKPLSVPGLEIGVFYALNKPSTVLIVFFSNMPMIVTLDSSCTSCFRYTCMKSRKPTPHEIKELVAFLPLLYKPEISPVKKWHGGDKDADDVITMPWPEYEPIVMEFIKVAECECWTDYDYLSESSRQILDNENVIKTADLDQIKTALTFCVRGERFCTGHWNSVIENGYVRRLLQRLAELGLNGEKS